MPSASQQRPANITLQTSEVTGKGDATNDNELAEETSFFPYGKMVRARMRSQSM